MDKGGFDKIIEAVNSSYPFLTPWVSVMIGRAVYYAHILKRFPTFTEWLLEPLLIGFMGVVCAGGMVILSELLGVNLTDPLAIGSASALGGVYGTKGIGMICNAIMTRVSGKATCSVHDLIETTDSKDKRK